jgi:hypothetical protein
MEKPSGIPEGFVQTVSSVSLAVQGFLERGSTLLSFRSLTVGSVAPDVPHNKEKPSGFPEGCVQTVSSVSLAVQGFFERGSTLRSMDF